MLVVEPHPVLELVAFETEFPMKLAEVSAPEIAALLLPGAEAPLTSDDATRAAIRDLLRHGGYKPTGRGKPSSEYLVRASGDRALSSINAAVDACNAVSLHSGLPISVVDLDRARTPFSVRIPGDTDPHEYVFNASGQTIDVTGLICLFDVDGPCANAVKDAQRTKTHGDTMRTLSIMWSSKTLAGRAEKAFAWYRELLDRIGARVERLPIETGNS
jgi:DNA/RNA-binding domain of Phe-tRNA-synthetase-like protein